MRNLFPILGGLPNENYRCFGAAVWLTAESDSEIIRQVQTASNFLIGSNIDKEDIVWINIFETPISIHGLVAAENNKFWRLPDYLIDQVNEGVTVLAQNTTGGRIRLPSARKVHAVNGMKVFSKLETISRICRGFLHLS